MDTQGQSFTSSKFFYDVFLSFSGKDTRNRFIAHLYDRLHRDGINTFKDDKELRKGDVISTALQKGIEESRMSIVVLSTKYASSSWCLDELVKILECKKKLKQRVMPVFYDVVPSEVRWKTGEFGKAFAKLKERFGIERMDKWAAALNEVANLSGSELQVLTNGDESEFIGKIIEDVKKEVNHTPLHVASYPVGIDSRAKDIELLLQKGSEDEVHMVGIYGLGGIGKTTLAKNIFNRLFRDVHFDGSCFLSNVSSQEEKIGLEKVQEKLLNILFKTEEFKVCSVAEGINLIKRKLGTKKVLIVLDDMDKNSQLESLAKEKEWFGSGSIIVITTRDERLLRGLGANERYKANLLNENESQQLFYRHAFDSLSPPQDYVGLAQDIIKYSGGLPLALVTLGSHLRGGSIKEWRSEFKKLEAIPHDDIQNILKISFDGLPHDDTKTVFLDIACAFHGLSEFKVTKILNACGFYFESAISTLVQRHLLQRDEHWLVMHDLVRDMGREIVRSESQYPGERSRLFIPEEVCAVLRGKNGSENVQVLRLDELGELEGVNLSTEAFEPMKKLRVLIINELCISGDFGLLSKELKWLSWKNCPLKSIPSNFAAVNLVVLDMRRSAIEEFGLNLQCCPKLKELNLSNCEHLKKTPNFSGARSLETLQLQYCNDLTEIDQSICQLNSLQVLDITLCFSIQTLPIDLRDMQNLRSLRASSTGIIQIPDFVEKLSKLETLEVGSLQLQANQGRVIKALSTSLKCLALKNFGLSEADIHVDIGSLSSLKSLDLSGNSFHGLPFDFSKLRFLKNLCLNDCENLRTLPSVSNLENLRILELRNCKRLVKITGLDNLPSTIQKINMINCSSLQNSFNEGFFIATALSFPSRKYQRHEFLLISLQCKEIPDWCSNKVTAPSICFTMPTHNKEYKFLGMVLWLDCYFNYPPFGSFVVAVSDGERVSVSRNFFFIITKGYGKVSCIYYLSCLSRPFDVLMIKGGEKITIYEDSDETSIKKIGIHLLYLDQHGNVTSFLAVVDHSYNALPERRSEEHTNSNNNMPSEISQVSSGAGHINSLIEEQSSEGGHINSLIEEQSSEGVFDTKEKVSHGKCFFGKCFFGK